jgi:aminopeptidase N
MLRHDLGDAAFWRSIAHYAGKHAHGSVETRDLARAIEEATGRNVDEMFDRWIARPGHPELEGRWDWDEDRKLGTLRLAQKQAITPEAPPFKFSAPVRFEIDGHEHEERLTISEATHAFEVRLPARPTQVIFDPGDVVLKSIRLEKNPVLWRRQLAAARLAIDRVAAARALGQLPDPAGIAALASALRSDAFWGVRAAAARALGQTRRDDAREALVAAIDDEHPRVRRAVAAALGDFLGDAAVGRTLADRLRRGDASYFVEAELALALGRTRAADALAVLPSLLDRPSYQDVIRSRAIEGLGRCGDERAFPIIRDAWRASVPWVSRRAIVAAVAELARGTGIARAAREFIETRLADRDFRVRGEAAVALARLGSIEATAALRIARAAELDGRARRRMEDAIRDLEAGTRPNEELRHLHDEVERLRGETAKLRERLDRIQAQPAAPPPPAAPAPKSKRPRPVTRRTRGSRPVRR